MKTTIKKALLFIVILMTGLTMQAQDQPVKLYKDKVITSNGSIIVGSIINYEPANSVTIELTNGNLLTFSSDQVKRVTMYSGKSKDVGVPFRSNKIYNETQFSILTGASATGLSLAHNVMFQYNRSLAMGVGFGVDNYYVSSGRDIFPIFANAKLNLRDGTSAPYIGTKIGYGLAFKKEADNIFEAQGGFMANPYFGYRLGSRGMIFNLFTGLKFQKADYRLVFGNETRVEDIFFRRLEIGFSIMF